MAMGSMGFDLHCFSRTISGIVFPLYSDQILPNLWCVGCVRRSKEGVLRGGVRWASFEGVKKVGGCVGGWVGQIKNGKV